MKSEEWVLGHALDFPFETTVSCDEPIVKEGKIYLCDNCGSTKLSRWAALMVGIKDPRLFYHKSIHQSSYDSKVEFNQKKILPEQVIQKLNLNHSNKKELIKMVNKEK